MKNINMYVIIIGISLYSSNIAIANDGEKLTERLRAISIDISNNDFSLNSQDGIIRTIWKNDFQQILQQRKAISEKTRRNIKSNTDVFIATFYVPEGKIILSATSTAEEDCKSFTNVGLPPDLIACPMKVAFIKNDEVNIIHSEHNFPFAIATDASGKFNNDSKTIYTDITIDTKTKKLNTVIKTEAASLSDEPFKGVPVAEFLKEQTLGGNSSITVSSMDPMPSAMAGFNIGQRLSNTEIVLAIQAKKSADRAEAAAAAAIAAATVSAVNIQPRDPQDITGEEITKSEASELLEKARELVGRDVRVSESWPFAAPLRMKLPSYQSSLDNKVINLSY